MRTMGYNQPHSHLAHHGIKGMKWGVRRFRNEDGSLTEAGKNRYYDEKGKLSAEGKRLESTYSNRNKIISGARGVTSGARQIVNASNNGPRNRYNKRKNLTQEEMDAMSDADLRALVNRLNLEQQYSNLTSDSSARSRVQTGLECADAVLSIVGGVLTAALAYKTLKG